MVCERFSSWTLSILFVLWWTTRWNKQVETATGKEKRYLGVTTANMFINLSARQTKPGTYANSVDPDETSRLIIWRPQMVEFIQG